MSSSSTLRKVLRSRTFWITTATISATILIAYDWYSDRYATPQTRLNRVKPDYQLSIKKLRQIRKAFVYEMKVGLNEADDEPDKKSSLKMLSTCIKYLPKGNETGVYYTLDWGGTNFRVLRIEFYNNDESKEQYLNSNENTKCANFSTNITEKKIEIEKEFMTLENDPSELFNYLACVLKDHMIDCNEKMDDEIPVGFTFSFPMKKIAINSGILLEWTKGYNIPAVVNKNICNFMHLAFKKHKINAKIHAICNDTVGTLLSFAYKYPDANVRIGLILGTGTNACYIESHHENDGENDGEHVGEEIINIEWGAFNKLLPRMPTDFIMDEYTPNVGLQLTEKMISGYYLGELTRLLIMEVFREKVTDYGYGSCLNGRWMFTSAMVSEILAAEKMNLIENRVVFENSSLLDILRDECGLKEFTEVDAKVLLFCCQMIVNRSADVVCCVLLGTLEKTGLYVCHRKDERNPMENDTFVLCEEYVGDGYITVGVDGSVFKLVPGYEQRMRGTIERMVGAEISSKIRFEFSDDDNDSSKGAALAVATHIAHMEQEV